MHAEVIISTAMSYTVYIENLYSSDDHQDLQPIRNEQNPYLVGAGVDISVQCVTIASKLPAQ